MKAGSPTLFECPRCGAKLVHENLSHSCVRTSVDAFLAGKPRDLFDRFVAVVASCGAYEVAPAKTRVAFLVKVRFASVNRVTPHAIDVHFVLPRRIESPRIARVEHVGNVYVHHLRLTKPEDFDRELKGWIRASRREYGERRWLRATDGSK